MSTKTTDQSVEEVRQILESRPITDSRKRVQESTDYKNTSTYLRIYGSTNTVDVRYERSPQFHQMFRKEGFAMNDYQKVSLFRDDKIELIGPHQVISKDGKGFEISKYYSNWEIDYNKFFKSSEEH
ncbi:hypothetical protein DLAC_06059 [Tieghemostelium lacteum]|uniref:Uncharacterized protein n=1 Tax=Tieghemostelium lacteum TaxID=361077 RepID=A0A151ZHB1_TIELA|nr:hypothetical protein DLAC_06059 [Tieghemostelium lacteum]|eukprot:KYQ93378.1 hypothetical protein DLAC_06059 [Tieghemostelium lacteum]